MVKRNLKHALKILEAYDAETHTSQAEVPGQGENGEMQHGMLEGDLEDPDDLSSIKRDAINTVENNAGPMQVEDLIELAEVLIDALTADDHQKKDGWAAVKQLYWDDYGATYDDDQDHWDKMRR